MHGSNGKEEQKEERRRSIKKPLRSWHELWVCHHGYKLCPMPCRLTCNSSYGRTYGRHELGYYFGNNGEAILLTGKATNNLSHGVEKQKNHKLKCSVWHRTLEIPSLTASKCGAHHSGSKSRLSERGLPPGQNFKVLSRFQSRPAVRIKRMGTVTNMSYHSRHTTTNIS